MKVFPGEIRRVGQGHKKVLDEEQIAWLKRYYPKTENARIAKAMDIGLEKLRDFVKELGLCKSEAGKKAIKRRQVRAMLKANNSNGCYDRKRGRPVSDATIAGRARRFEEERLGLRENPQKRIRREEPEKYRLWMQKRSEERKEIVRKEKLRVLYGLPRKTKLKTVVMCPYRRSQIARRYNALRRGYIIMEDCSEGSPDRYVIYYDDETRRSEAFEKNLLNDGFFIKKWA